MCNNTTTGELYAQLGCFIIMLGVMPKYYTNTCSSVWFSVYSTCCLSLSSNIRSQIVFKCIFHYCAHHTYKLPIAGQGL